MRGFGGSSIAGGTAAHPAEASGTGELVTGAGTLGTGTHPGNGGDASGAASGGMDASMSGTGAGFGAGTGSGTGVNQNGGASAGGHIPGNAATQSPGAGNASAASGLEGSGNVPGGSQLAGERSADGAQAYRPEDYNFALPEGVQADAGLMGRFKEFCAGTGLTPAQAEAAVRFWQTENESGAGLSMERCEAALQERWKGRYHERLEGARRALSMLDARMEGRLMPLARSGIGNHPVFAELMGHLADAIGEDVVAPATGGGHVASSAMSTEDFLKHVVFKR